MNVRKVTTDNPQGELNMRGVLTVVEAIFAAISIVAAPTVSSGVDAGLAFTLLVFYPLAFANWLDKHYFPP